MITIDVDELEKCLAYLQVINQADLKKLAWVRKGKRVKVPKIYIEEWKYVGLSNLDFYRTEIKNNVDLNQRNAEGMVK